MKTRTKGIILLFSLLLSLLSCSGSDSGVSFNKGNYTAQADGKYGPVTVEVEFSEKQIKKITVDASGETPAIAGTVVERLPEAIIENQSLAIDALAGATLTSEAVLAAVEDCVVQAGADPALLKGETEKGPDEEIQTGVVIVGGGASGSAAAVSAAEAGAETLLLEMTASPAGQGTQAGGAFGTNSTQQIEQGREVDGKWFYDQFMATGNYQVNGGLLSRIIQRSGETIDWLIAHGANMILAHPATGGYYEHKLTHPNSTLHGYVDGGTVAIKALHQSVIDAGGKVLYETEVEDILLEDGRVSGVIARKADGGTLTVKADAVILTTGGFGGNEELVAEYFGEGFGRSRVGTNIGTGIKLAQKAGGDADYANAITMHYGVSRGGTGWTTPLNSALLNPYLHVDVDGNRFMNEESFIFEPIKSSNVLKSLPGRTAWEIFDSRMINVVAESGYAALTDVFAGELATDPTVFIEVGHTVDTSKRYEQSHTPADVMPDIEKYIEKGTIVRAESPEELAEALGMNHLADTIARYNELAELGEDLDHFKSSQYLEKLEGTLYAVKITPSVFLGTLGGIRINPSCEVVDYDGKAVPGLYAAGAETSGVYSDSYVYFEGGTLGYAYGSGRIAGES
ncbi:MAG: FAD-dependent oxidoreductase, partial [Spirochaetales bacterium]|nr:FAD-dependent oxidoreductase [Spirochaetales bacterium]